MAMRYGLSGLSTYGLYHHRKTDVHHIYTLRHPFIFLPYIVSDLRAL